MDLSETALGRFVTKARWLVVIVLLILATLGTIGVFLYSHPVQGPEKIVGQMVPIVVSKVDIPARTDLNKLLRNDQFRVLDIPQAAVVDGAVTSVDQLRDRRNTVAILAGEQISVERLRLSGHR
jgi:hypothetical protein